MGIQVWSTRDALEPVFERQWMDRLSRVAVAHFAVGTEYLLWEADQGRHALAALVDEGGRCAAIVLRELPRRFESGWPWRWQAFLEDTEKHSACGMSREDAVWILKHAKQIAGSRLFCYLPVRSIPRHFGFKTGTTIMRSLDSTEEEIFRSMSENKRREIRKAKRQGYEIVEANSQDQLLAYRTIERETYASHGITVPADEHTDPGAGQGWRQWELPWNWLLIAVKNGKVVGGSGFGRLPGGTIEYRGNASLPETRNRGVNALLGWEAICRGRDQGYRWLNWGGSTEFKRRMGGESVEINCYLEGRARWFVPNLVLTATKKARLQAASWKKSLRRR